MTVHVLPGPTRQHLVTQQAINGLAIHEMATADTTFTAPSLLPHANPSHSPHFEHYASPMVHPVTGKTISSYKKFMNDPATAEVWQTAFSPDVGGMAQGCDKTGQRGTNAMFVMTHKEIAHALRNGKKFTYFNPVVDYRPQKEHPNRICIMASGNLISYDSELSVRMADINTAKLHWNSVVSKKDAEYMCININIFFLSAALEYFEYMHIPLDLFPSWTINQYNLHKHAYNGFVYIEMRRAVWGLPQAGILANKHLWQTLAMFVYFGCDNTPGLCYDESSHEPHPVLFTLVVDNFGVKYAGK